MKTLTLREKVGNRIRLLRKSHNHSQEFLSEKINASKDRISKTERGIAFINDELLDGLCKFYNVKESYFFTFNKTIDNLDRSTAIENINAELAELSIRKLNKIEQIIKIIKA